MSMRIVMSVQNVTNKEDIVDHETLVMDLEKHLCHVTIDAISRLQFRLKLNKTWKQWYCATTKREMNRTNGLIKLLYGKKEINILFMHLEVGSKKLSGGSV